MSAMKLSIIMPCYNCEKTVTEAVESIYTQELNYTFEVIMLDDGSTDKTWEILQRFEQQYNEVRVFQNDSNMGEGYSRNKCNRLAEGEIIGYLDADNLFDKNCLNNMVHYIDKHNLDGAHIERFKRFSKTIRKFQIWTFESKNLNLKNYLSNKKIFDHFFFKKKHLNYVQYFENHGIGSLDISLKILSSKLKIRVVPNTSLYHRFFAKEKSLYERTYESGFLTFHSYHCYEFLFYLLSDGAISKILDYDITNLNQYFISFLTSNIFTSEEIKFLSNNRYQNWDSYYQTTKTSTKPEDLLRLSSYYYQKKQYNDSNLMLLM